jgi:hypothetical protein
MVLLRWLAGGMDFSYFAVAGSDFVNTAQVPLELHTESGPGYDGQFFLRYAIDPFTTERTAYGITLDHPAYRHQRIVYPLMAWLLSFGYPALVPFALVLVNVLALMALLFLALQFCRELNIHSAYSLFPLLFSGLWMSLGRDLSEPLECLFIFSALYRFYHQQTGWFVLFSTLAVLSREPSAIILLPIAIVWALYAFSANAYKVDLRLVRKALLLSLPFVTVLLWKIGLRHWHQSEHLVEGGNNIGLPLCGLFQGFWEGIHHLHTPTGYVEFSLWLAFVLWNGWLLLTAGKALRFKPQHLFEFSLSISWLTTLLMASVYTYSIYVDDWAFLRVLAGFNLLSVMLVLSTKKRLPKKFIWVSAILVISTMGRLLLRI